MENIKTNIISYKHDIYMKETKREVLEQDIQELLNEKNSLEGEISNIQDFIDDAESEIEYFNYS